MPFETSAISISEAISLLDELLDPGAFDDLGPNGLQVPGRETITKVVTGVSAQRELIDRAVELEAELVLVHHGLFWNFLPTGLSPTLAERVRPLFKHDIALAAYHLPLDAHPRSATTRCWRGCWAASATRRSRRSGASGSSPATGCRAHELFARVQLVTQREPLVFDAGPERVRRIGDHLRLGRELPAPGGRRWVWTRS